VRIWSIENREELVRLFFRKDDAKYAGVIPGHEMIDSCCAAAIPRSLEA